MVGFDKLFDDQLLIDPSLNFCDKNLIGVEILCVLKLVGKDICFLLIIHIVIHHAPHRRIPGT
ncbi:hypothetical protein SDC9_161956 [bioreactor metagenome]|uniref:Uncharacterized protein n=1 Tax=bioreactor metagenome TaxID=1076179 RepID=A0A645FMR2_9ZZZZ